MFHGGAASILVNSASSDFSRTSPDAHFSRPESLSPVSHVWSLDDHNNISAGCLLHDAQKQSPAY